MRRPTGDCLKALAYAWLGRLIFWNEKVETDTFLPLVEPPLVSRFALAVAWAAAARRSSREGFFFIVLKLLLKKGFVSEIYFAMSGLVRGATTATVLSKPLL